MSIVISVILGLVVFGSLIAGYFLWEKSNKPEHVTDAVVPAESPKVPVDDDYVDDGVVDDVVGTDDGIVDEVIVDDVPEIEEKV